VPLCLTPGPYSSDGQAALWIPDWQGGAVGDKEGDLPGGWNSQRSDSRTRRPKPTPLSPRPHRGFNCPRLRGRKKKKKKGKKGFVGDSKSMVTGNLRQKEFTSRYDGSAVLDSSQARILLNLLGFCELWCHTPRNNASWVESRNWPRRPKT